MEPTAALVMELGKDFYYSSKLSREYFDLLDLSSSSGMIREYEKQTLWLLSQAISNRKCAFQRLTMDLIRETPGKCQVVILAAGTAPLGMEIAGSCGDKVTGVFEVDQSDFGKKAELYSELIPKQMKSVHFLQDNILSEKLISRMNDQGLNPMTKTIIVMEGITYYISGKEMQTIFDRFKGRSERNCFLVEIGRPMEKVPKEFQPHVLKMFEPIEKRFLNGRHVARYETNWMESEFASRGGQIKRIVWLDDMEKMRLGKNSVFPEPKSYWAEIMVAEL